MTGHYTFSFDPMLPLWLIGILLAAALALFLFSFRGNKSKSLFRFLFAALLILFLCQPQLVTENRKPLNDIVLIATDKSQSQNFGNRLETTQTTLRQLQEKLKNVQGMETRIIDVASGAKDETKVFDAIEAALSDVPQNQRAGVILLSDGQVSDKPSAEFLKSTPFFAALTGSKKDKDREVELLNAPGYSVVGETVILKFRIADQNIPGSGTASVTLSMPDGTQTTRDIVIGEDQEWPIDISNAGQNVFELSTPPIEGELSLLNNRAVFTVEGVRNRLNVLLVSGEPYPGARMWRDFLKADPGVDLVHFTILRSPEKVDMTPSSELSLIAFPFQELFERKLKNFDLIVMDRFSLTTALPDFYFQNMARYVENGGALMEISGPSYVSETSLHFTSLGTILPGIPSGVMARGEFKPAITDIGKTHPVTMPFVNQSWGPWMQQVPVQIKEGETIMSGMDGLPLLTLSHVGEGRVAQLTSDQIWLWARGFEGGGPAKELLRRTVHWLMKEPELDETAMKISTDNNNINIKMRGQDDAQPITVTAPDGTISTLTPAKDQDGWLSAGITNAKDGIYKFSSGNRQKIISLGNVSTPEFTDIVSTDEKLLPIAKVSKGDVVWAENKNLNFNLRRNQSSSLISSQAKPILPPEIMIIIGLLAGLLLWWNESRKSRG
ncbi:MAG: hypothetical protein DI586_10255 [Micavibrio aeruginosavorus]|uniref:Glutamine amidotransferase domain-containing protein n=1 Tax=Micavibrio aeruginosavorus TaxID=349221 RepID=A0A2W5FK39_9BACT|nr:MAG: hypothetical protein DI586_10255 [Micavibrio aeruginosavorus]